MWAKIIELNESDSIYWSKLVKLYMQLGTTKFPNEFLIGLTLEQVKVLLTSLGSTD